MDDYEKPEDDNDFLNYLDSMDIETDEHKCSGCMECYDLIY